MIRDKRILITGGAGFIGTHVAERLVDGNQVTLLDIDLDNALPYSPLATGDAVRRIQGDVRDADVVGEEVAQADIVLHYASLIGVQNVIDHARATIDTIILGTRNVLEAARRRGRLDRLVYISTSEVYGNIMDAREGQPASIGTGNDARLSYASAKLMGEHLVWAYRRDFGLPTVIVRPFNIYGARRKAGHAIGYFAVKALAGREVVVHGDGSQLRAWCYIDDFCDAMMACIEREAAVGGDFNIGNPVTATTIYDLAERIIELAGSSSPLRRTEHTYSDIGVRAPNSIKARACLDYTPRYGLNAGLRPTIEWYRQHLDDFRHWL